MGVGVTVCVTVTRMRIPCLMSHVFDGDSWEARAWVGFELLGPLYELVSRKAIEHMHMQEILRHTGVTGPSLLKPYADNHHRREDIYAGGGWAGNDGAI